LAGEEASRKETTLLYYFKNKSEELPVDPKTADDPVYPNDPPPGHYSCQ
jgi:hypothetical protein